MPECHLNGFLLFPAVLYSYRASLSNQKTLLIGGSPLSRMQPEVSAIRRHIRLPAPVGTSAQNQVWRCRRYRDGAPPPSHLVDPDRRSGPAPVYRSSE